MPFGFDPLIDPDTTGCPYADEQLLPAMRETETFIDQEAVNPHEIESLHVRHSEQGG